MNKPRRRFSLHEKLEILAEVNELGSAAILRKYSLSPSALSCWQRDLKKSDALATILERHKAAHTIESLKAEIERLNKIIADQHNALGSNNR